MMTADRIAGYAYRQWMKAGMTEWPELRRVARALRIRQSEIEDYSGDGPFMLTGYNVEGHIRGDLYVEAMTHDVDVAWCGYWLPHSAGCVCGDHKTT